MGSGLAARPPGGRCSEPAGLAAIGGIGAIGAGAHRGLAMGSIMARGGAAPVRCLFCIFHPKMKAK